MPLEVVPPAHKFAHILCGPRVLWTGLTAHGLHMTVITSSADRPTSICTAAVVALGRFVFPQTITARGEAVGDIQIPHKRTPPNPYPASIAPTVERATPRGFRSCGFIAAIRFDPLEAVGDRRMGLVAHDLGNATHGEAFVPQSEHLAILDRQLVSGAFQDL